MGKIGDLFVRLGLKSDDYKKGMNEAKKETQSFSQKLGNMKAGALAVWAAIGAGVMTFAKDFIGATNKMGDAWAHAMSSMKASYQSVLADLSNYKPDFSSFKGFFKNEFNWIKKAFGNAKEAGDAAREMSKAFDAEFELVNSVRLQRTMISGELNELYIKMRDTTLSPADRQAAADRYKSLLQPLADAEIAIYGNMMEQAVNAWQAGSELSRKYSSAEVQDFFANYGTDAAGTAAKYPELAKVYENRKNDAANQQIFDILNKMEAATNEMSEVNKMTSRTEIAIKRELQAMQEEHQKNLAEIVDEVADVADDIELLPDEIVIPEIDTSSLDKYEARLQEFTDNWAAEQQEIAMLNAMLTESIVASIGSGMEAFTDMLFGLEGADASAILGALMQPFADTAGQLGGMLLAQGIAVEAFKTSLESLQGAPAIAAGLSLLAISAAMKSGIKALAKGGASAGSAASYGGGSYGSDMAQDYESTLTVNVVGHISGSDILLSLDRTRNKQRR